MSLTYKQVVYLFNRSIDWMDLPDADRTKRIKDEMQKIDWALVPDDHGEIDYRNYYKEGSSCCQITG